MNLPEWVVLDVVPNKDYTLLLIFADGEKKIYDARPLLNKAIYAQLKSLPFFSLLELNVAQSSGAMMLISHPSTYMSVLFL